MVMSYVWVLLLGISLFCGLLGPGADLGAAAMEGAARGVTVCVSLAGPLVLWSGFEELLARSGVREVLGRALAPILGRLFPTARRDEETMGALAGNVTANLLGLGNAATPLGIRALQGMRAQADTDAATHEMCRLVVMNTASIQLLPTTVAALRGSLGSSAPLDILPGVWITSVCSVTVGLLAAWLLGRLWP